MTEPTIRPLRTDDADAVARIFFDAVHEGTKDAYSEQQRNAWAGDAPDPGEWRRKLEGVIGYVAEIDSHPVGFMTVDASGYVDFAFVHPSAAGTGVGRRLYQAVETKAQVLGATAMTANASKVAKPFFEGQGWSLVAEQTVERHGVALTNFRMQKSLTHPSPECA